MAQKNANQLQNANQLSILKDKQIGDYSILDLIGKGISWEVYRAKRLLDQRMLACKVVEKQKMQGKEILRLQFEREMRLMKMVDSEHVIRFVDYLENNTHCFLLTEIGEKGQLEDHIIQKGRLSEEEAIGYLKEIVFGLQELAKHNIIHRNLTSRHIMLNAKGLLQIGAFGFATTVQEKDNVFFGPPQYMAPEILAKAQYTGKCDIWSLGIIFYQMLFGRVPYGAQQLQVNITDLLQEVQNKPLDLQFNNVQTSAECKDLLTHCLTVNQVQRMDLTAVCNHPLIKLNDEEQQMLQQKGLQHNNK